MLKEIRRNWSTKTLWVFLSCLAIATVYVHHQSRLEQENLALTNLSITYGEHVKSALHQSLSAAYSLGAYMKSKGEARRMSDFEVMAGEILTYYPHIMAFQLAPQGVIKRVVPAYRHSETIGQDVFKDPARHKESMAAKRNRELTLVGPFELSEGRVGVVGQLPLFIEVEYEGAQFWGFVMVWIRFPDILESINWEALESEGITYRLSKISPHSGEKEVIFGSTREDSLSQGIENLLSLPGTTWSLELFPPNSWGKQARPFLEGVAGLGLAFLISSWVSFIYRRKREEILENLAFFDPLTKLPNRTRLFDYFGEFLANSKRRSHGLLVGFLDLDRFKQVNDQHGHKIGDLLLLSVVERLEEHMRKEDMLSRQGGDEFIFLWPGISSRQQCEARLEQILKLFEKPFIVEGLELWVHASIGISFYRNGRRDLDALITEADAAMYQAKMAGRGRYRFYETEAT